MSTLLHTYRNGGTEVFLYADGTKVRLVQEDTPPQICEQMDLKITDWCDAGCAWCHEGSTVRGRHAELNETLELLRALPAGAEIAIGGGDPLSHPHFELFVRSLRSQGLVPSVTVNGRHFERSRPLLERLTQEGVLFGVGLSYFDKLPDWDYESLVLHLIAGIHPPSVLDAARKPLKVLLLGYKHHGRGNHLARIKPDLIQGNISSWYRELFWVAHTHKLSFDNLAISQLKPQRLFSDHTEFERRYMGPEGAYSMYVDAVTRTYGLSSYSTHRYRWSNLRDMFSHVRSLQDLSAQAA